MWLSLLLALLLSSVRWRRLPRLLCKTESADAQSALE